MAQKTVPQYMYEHTWDEEWDRYWRVQALPEDDLVVLRRARRRRDVPAWRSND